MLSFDQPNVNLIPGMLRVVKTDHSNAPLDLTDVSQSLRIHLRYRRKWKLFFTHLYIVFFSVNHFCCRETKAKQSQSNANYTKEAVSKNLTSVKASWWMTSLLCLVILVYQEVLCWLRY